MSKTAKHDYKAVVHKILESDIKSRDSDLRLYWLVARQIGVPLDNMNVEELFVRMTKKTLPAFRTICRMRAKEQELDPQMRGKKYASRQKAAVEIRKQMVLPIV